MIGIEISGKLFSCARGLCANERDQQTYLTHLENFYRVTTINEADEFCKTIFGDMPLTKEERTVNNRVFTTIEYPST